ncbi:hypothetical protein [Burkholderia cenocepacia]|uniref:hypothetical protein n=1 Tax=Burkholderia cenocepacia TaxID=95486 RepID=UPI0019056246|nr:hypothetical protein [Burkholderia cenocepacia]MBJ9694133.1 hypothetical protein [Burkholderia cenocepacia]
MNKIKDGGPAFGQVVELRCVRVEMDGSAEYEPEAMLHGGLTVRDYFAAKAMRVCAPRHVHPDSEVRYVAPISFDDLANDAYALADAMLRARGEA